MLDYPIETVEQQDGETVLKSKNEYRSKRPLPNT